MSFEYPFDNVACDIASAAGYRFGFLYEVAILGL